MGTSGEDKIVHHRDTETQRRIEKKEEERSED
jgi:hypothetical protein